MWKIYYHNLLDDMKNVGNMAYLFPVMISIISNRFDDAKDWGLASLGLLIFIFVVFTLWTPHLTKGIHLAPVSRDRRIAFIKKVIYLRLGISITMIIVLTIIGTVMRTNTFVYNVIMALYGIVLVMQMNISDLVLSYQYSSDLQKIGNVGAIIVNLLAILISSSLGPGDSLVGCCALLIQLIFFIWYVVYLYCNFYQIMLLVYSDYERFHKRVDFRKQVNKGMYSKDKYNRSEV